MTLGGYDEMQMAYEILEGLTAEDYIAFPSETCVAGAVTTHDPAEASEATGDDSQGEFQGDPAGLEEPGIDILPDGQDNLDVVPLPDEEGENANILAPTGGAGRRERCQHGANAVAHLRDWQQRYAESRRSRRHRLGRRPGGLKP